MYSVVTMQVVGSECLGTGDGTVLHGHAIETD